MSDFSKNGRTLKVDLKVDDKEIQHLISVKNKLYCVTIDGKIFCATQKMLTEDNKTVFESFKEIYRATEGDKITHIKVSPNGEVIAAF